MARSDLIVNLVKSGSRGDHANFRRTVEAIAAEEKAQQHNILAANLINSLNESSEPLTSLNGSDSISSLINSSIPKKNINDLILSQNLLVLIKDFIEEQNRTSLLRSYNLEPRNRLLFIGPPGNGKTSLAESIAKELMLPIYNVRYENLIGSYLGETSTRLRKVFDYIRTQKCVLFFDEFDTLGKERGDVHETGEIKRVVSSLLLQIDSLPSYVIVIGATNHPELLDRAVWRRFQIKLKLNRPNQKQIISWLSKFETDHKLNLGYKHATLAKAFLGMNFSEIEDLSTDVLRKYVLNLPDAEIKQILSQRLTELKSRDIVNKHN